MVEKESVIAAISPPPNQRPPTQMKAYPHLIVKNQSIRAAASLEWHPRLTLGLEVVWACSVALGEVGPVDLVVGARDAGAVSLFTTLPPASLTGAIYRGYKDIQVML